MNDPDDLVTLEITLRRLVDPEGRLGWKFARTEGAHHLELLALLMAGVGEVLGEMQHARRRDVD